MPRRCSSALLPGWKVGGKLSHPPRALMPSFGIGAIGRNRTYNLRITGALLCLLSYNGINEPHGCSVGRLKGGDADEMNHHYIPNDSIKYTICNPNTI